MPFKINISEKGKTYKLEADIEALIGKKIGDKVEGKEIKQELEGYELEITGTSDKAGFPGKIDIEGSALKKVLLKKGWGIKDTRKGLRLKKTVRGNTISRDTIQINMKIIKQGNRKLEEIFPKTKEKPTEEKPEEEQKTEEKPEEEKKEKGKEENKQEQNK
jgi:small subunit ribosomal protein S6e